MATRLRLLLLLAPLALGACDLLGIEPLSAVQARREAEGKAVGSACRHAGRAIEDCYTLNRKADKAAVFAGWREMNDYMTENKIEVVAPSLPTPEALASKSSEEEEEEDVVETKPAKPAKGDKSAKPAPSTKGG